MTLNVMVWRIHFTAADLERIQVGPTLGPLAETVMAVSVLRCPQPSRALLSEWRGQVQDRITPRMRPLTALIPPGCKGVDLCTLTGEAPTIEQGVRAGPATQDQPSIQSGPPAVVSVSSIASGRRDPQSLSAVAKTPRQGSTVLIDSAD